MSTAPSPARRIVENPAFRTAVLAAIVAGAACVGLETSPGIMERFGSAIRWTDRIVIAFFVVEILLRIAAEGRHPLRFFRDGWNVFDFLIVLACVLPFGPQYLQVFRLARVLRALRLVSALPGLQILVTATLKAIPSLLYVMIMLSLLLYSYGVIGVFLFGANDPVHFGSLPRSLLTLFSVLTLEGWVDVLRIQMVGSDVFPDYPAVLGDREPVPSAQPFAAVVYFISFVVFGTMIVLNLFVGIVVQGMEAAHEEVMRGRTPA